MNTSLISVIMPCYNAENYVESAVESVFRQTHANVELIVVDDGSTDKSYSVLTQCQQKYPNLKVFQQSNQGPFPARNLALKHATGEFIAFLDADDYWAANFLEKLLQGIENNNADLSYCGWQNVVEGGENGPAYLPNPYEKGDISQAFLASCPWPIHAALVRREVIEKANGFSLRRFSAMDYDLWIRISAITRNIVLVPEVLAFYRWHNHGQISSVKWRQVLDAWQVRKDFVTQNPELVAHIPQERLDELVNGSVFTQAYSAFWKRDLVSSQRLFREIFKSGIWRFKDLKYIGLSFLPYAVLSRIV
ncbi:glycosyltransferase family 2 protein [Methylomonas koyamae]|uniref:glycosyltransferase family 2 protein n=1 Tax=Methylomonas koyamae TaxID=702114 RepID=UPI000BC3221E|nr:glycosyltransferase [Methylomonas koyamae]ATG91907.1 glycosyl transferase family 2 [Methylomonas koyamae]